MMDYDLWKTTEPSRLPKGLRKGTYAYEQYMKDQFAQSIVEEIDNGSWEIDYIVEKFFGGYGALKKAIEDEVSSTEEAFQNFCDDFES